MHKSWECVHPWVCRRQGGSVRPVTNRRTTVTRTGILVGRSAHSATRGFRNGGVPVGGNGGSGTNAEKRPNELLTLLVRAQRLVQGRARPPGQPPGPPAGRAPRQHRHLTGAPLARRRAAARADPAHPVRAVLRTLRLCRRRRGPGAARRPPAARRVRGRPALGGPADRRADQRVLAQRPDAGAPRLPRHLAGAVRGPRPHRAHAALAGARARRAPAAPRTPEPRPPRAGRPPALRARAGAAGVHHRDVPPVGRASAAAGCAARPSSASCTRSPTCSRSRSPGRPRRRLFRSPPNWPSWPAG